MDRFAAVFSQVSDPRQANVRHRLGDVLFIALAAILSGCETCADMAEFGVAKRVFLKSIMNLPHGTPSHDTFSRVFRLIDPAQFEPIFARFAQAFGKALPAAPGLAGEVVAVDGKALRGAFLRGRRTSPLHTVSLWATQARLTLATRLAPGRNEVQGVLDALALIDLTGATVTADALHCRADVTQAIRDRGGDFCITLKANQPGLVARAKALLDSGTGAQAADTPSADTPARAHDRTEARTAVIVAAGSLSDTCYIKGIAAVGRVTSLHQTTGDAAPAETSRLYILSKLVAPEDLLALSRTHWGIENHLHHVLDVTFKEDACRSRKDHGPLNLACLRRIALTLIRRHPDNASLRIKVKKAAWNDAFLREVMAHMR